MTGQFTIGTFIDIASAFDKSDSVKATKALKRRGIDRDITDWYRDYLTHRYAMVELKGIKRSLRINTGCPQGGVLSTLLWSMPYDDLLARFNFGKVAGIGYADDGALVMCGKNLTEIFQNMTTALNSCTQWAQGYDLTISEEKTNYIFTNKKRIQFENSL